MAEPSLQLRLSQKLALAPQLQQAIRLLQLNRIELREYIQDALDANPILERTEGDESEANPEPEQNEQSSETDPASDSGLQDWEAENPGGDTWLESPSY